MAGVKQQQKRETVAPQAGHEQHVCPACGGLVETVVRRRKSLGVFVPEWAAGPCRSPDCSRYAAP
ncbi:hypothetical protein [Streptomyces subrutilus]|uniref:Uncharacterized protein n=1 Tax=Streptomyces subrutilus TaxID=36818 RepID=A0A1E5PVW7_9ACTN|nr:hypothetical protein [Streptomyces subrutilus]OEJ33685.1 hypothetical protein BGK67_22180 [Streptomyces subrutilus]